MRNRILLSSIVVMLVMISSCSVLNIKKSNHSNNSDNLQAKEYFLDAMKQKVLENTLQQQVLLEKTLEIAPNHGPANYEMAKIEVDSARYNTALEYIEKAVNSNDKNKWYLLLKAEILEKSGDYKKSVAIYDNLIARFPQNPDYYMQAAYINIIMGKYQEAIAYYDKLEDLVGVSEALSYQKQKLYLQLNDIDGAINEIDKLIEHFPSEPKNYNIIANLYGQAKRIEEAEKTYIEIAKRFPEDPYVHINFADFLKKNNMTNKAFVELKKGFASEYLDLETKIQVLKNYYSISEIYTEQKAQTLALAKILVETHPDKEKAHSLYADLLFKDNQLVLAQIEFQKSIEINQSSFFNWESMLNIILQQRKYDTLLVNSLKAIELFPMQSTPYFFAGISYMETKKLIEAKNMFIQGMKLVYDNKPLKTQFLIYLGEVAHELKEYEQSDNFFDKAISLDPENSFLLNNYSYYLSLRKEKLNKAEEYAKKAVSIDQDNSNNQDTYGWVLFNLKRYEEAAFWIEKAIHSSEKPSGVVLDHYGDVLFKLNRIDEALIYWKKAKKSGEELKNVDKKIKLKRIIEE